MLQVSRVLRWFFAFTGIAVDQQLLLHECGGSVGITEMLLTAKELQLKARVITSEWSWLGKTPTPTIAERRDGTFFIVGRALDDTIRIHEPVSGRSQTLNALTSKLYGADGWCLWRAELAWTLWRGVSISHGF